MKVLLKGIARAMSLWVASPFAVLALLGKHLFRTSSLFNASAELLSLFPGKVGTYIRSAYYHMTIARFDLSSYILFGSIITKMETMIGKNCGIGCHTSIGLARIGDRVGIANYVSVLSGGLQHDFSDSSRGPLEVDGVYKCIEIGDRVFVGERSIVMANLGTSSIVAAGSVVAKDVPECVVVAGYPAIIVKRRGNRPQSAGSLCPQSRLDTNEEL